MSTNPMFPMTKLDAVNGMLSSIGQAPVSTLTVTGIRDVALAELALDSTTREVLNRGWSFNTDTDWPLTPDVNGNIPIPASALDLDPVDRWQDFVQRDNEGTMMLYDKCERSFTFTDAVKVNITWGFDFGAVPQVARTYIATRAARIFQANVIGSNLLFKFTELHESEARVAMERLEDQTQDTNMLTAPTEANRVIFQRRSNGLR
jgi:hypothetical protein